MLQILDAKNPQRPDEYLLDPGSIAAFRLVDRQARDVGYDSKNFNDAWSAAKKEHFDELSRCARELHSPNHSADEPLALDKKTTQRLHELNDQEFSHRPTTQGSIKKFIKSPQGQLLAMQARSLEVFSHALWIALHSEPIRSR